MDLKDRRALERELSELKKSYRDILNSNIKLSDEIRWRIMNKIYLYIMNTEKKFSFFKYFDTEFEKDKYKRKLKHIPYLMILEDSSDMNWGNN